MDFYEIRYRTDKKEDRMTVYPDYQVVPSRDLMIRGGAFYAVWDDEAGLWSTNDYRVRDMVDQDLRRYAHELQEKVGDKYDVEVNTLRRFSSRMWTEFQRWSSNVGDNYHQLDESLTFADTPVRKEDYASKRLPYSLRDGDYSAWDELISTLYDPEERAKIEWSIGAIVNGDGRTIQKFLVFYGEAGSGKSTVLNVVEKLFEGYSATFDSKALTGSNNQFALESFRENPLVAIQHDGDLSRIEDNTKLNSLVSHENMVVNEKFKSTYSAKSGAFLFMGTNKPVKITDSKSGVIRRLIDVTPSGRLLDPVRYEEVVSAIDGELGAIAKHCLDVYLGMGRHYYNGYRPMSMMFKTDVFFNFVEEHETELSVQPGIELQRAYDMYKIYCEDTRIDKGILPRYKFREELKTYYEGFQDRVMLGGERYRSFYSGFRHDLLRQKELANSPEVKFDLEIRESRSHLDDIYRDCKAQYSSEKGTPLKRWDDVTTVLADIDTSQEHYVIPPQNHIVIDFDLRDERGKKSAELNLQAASEWPETYSEFSKSGAGVHLHYIYDGDASALSSVYSEGIEVKTFPGHSSLRRKVIKCHNAPIAHISTGLPLKELKVISEERVKSEKALRALVIRNLRKEIHSATKPSIDFIKKILDDAYSDGLQYDLRDMRPKVMAFANNSTNQSALCMKLVSEMRFTSGPEETEAYSEDDDSMGGDLVFFDCEVFPNLFVVCWKREGSDQVIRMINPTPEEIGALFKEKLVGFYNRKYDNHILYGRYLGYSNKQLFDLSYRLVSNSPNATFADAYSVSYTDVYDYANTKMSLKKWEIELGIHHQELGIPWDEPVPESRWGEVAEYCVNDVIATEAVHNHLAADWVARQVLSGLSGLSVNQSTNQHTASIIFGKDKRPQSKFVYTDLSKDFPGYEYKNGKSTYRGEVVGEGGYVYAEPGIYYDVAVLDIASMHPSSAIALNLFGDEYTKRFGNVLNARIAVKHEDWDAADKLLENKLMPIVDGLAEKGVTVSHKAMAFALKIPINSVYGMTAAKFENRFRDPRNVDNIVAKRGALFMVDLKHFVQEKGFIAAHIKTDSIKIPNATPEIIQEVMDFGARWGYTFEHEDTYAKMCLVNDAVYIAQYGEYKGYKWTATGAQFQHPVVFKTIFSHEPLTFDDYCETKSTTTELYLDGNENLPEGEHSYQFIGKVGKFVPVKPGSDGGILLRKLKEPIPDERFLADGVTRKKDDPFEKDGVDRRYFSAAGGSKGFRWMEAETAEKLSKEELIDKSYSTKLVDAAIEQIRTYGDYEAFVA